MSEVGRPAAHDLVEPDQHGPWASTTSDIEDAKYPPTCFHVPARRLPESHGSWTSTPSPIAVAVLNVPGPAVAVLPSPVTVAVLSLEGNAMAVLPSPSTVAVLLVPPMAWA